MTFRELTPEPDELRQLLALSNAWAAEDSCYGYVANSAADFAKERIFAALEGTAIVGYLCGHVSAAKNIQSIIKDGVSFFSVEELYVAPAERSRGIGAALFGFAEARLAAQGLRYLLLTTATKDHDAIRRFYVERAGMTPWSMTLFKELPAADKEKQPLPFRIIPFEARYRDDLIFMVLEAKNALGRRPALNEDLLDIDGCYLKKGDMFWLALDENDRVIGCIGCCLLPGEAAVLHRLYVRHTLKRKGIGTALLKTAEGFARENGRKTVRVHLGDRCVYAASRAFYPKRGYRFVDDDHMEKQL